jgi:hypothetical protein
MSILPASLRACRKKPELHRAATISRTLPHQRLGRQLHDLLCANFCNSVKRYSFWSGSGDEEKATGKLPVRGRTREWRSFSAICNGFTGRMQFSMDEYQRVMQDGKEEGSIGSVFRGVQALCSEEGE